MVPEALCTIDRLGGADDFLGCGSCFEADNEGNCENCVVQKIFNEYAMITGQLTQSEKDISNAEHRFGEWIPCSERLPEESLNSVIGWDEYRQRCCFVQYYGGRWNLGDNRDSVKIVAWMQVPRPYREETKNE